MLVQELGGEFGGGNFLAMNYFSNYYRLIH